MSVAAVGNTIVLSVSFGALSVVSAARNQTMAETGGWLRPLMHMYRVHYSARMLPHGHVDRGDGVSTAYHQWSWANVRRLMGETGGLWPWSLPARLRQPKSVDLEERVGL